MKVLTFCGFITILVLGVFNDTHSRTKPPASSSFGQIQDESLMRPNDVAYADAIAFAQYLNTHGVTVQSVHGSKLGGMFRGVEKAAFIRTDKGIVEIVFFPGPMDAERIRVTYTKNAIQIVPHKYVIEQPITHDTKTIEAAYPVYFTLHKNWFIETSESELDAILKRVLGQDNRQNRQ